jgi:hypothetical protein
VKAIMRLELKLWTSAVALAACSAAVGCNAVLDNESGELADGGIPTEDASFSGDSASPAPQSDAAPAPVVDANPPPTGDDAQTVPPSCALGQKLCDGACVSVDDPLFGCGPTSCAPCELDHTTATCAATGCAVGTCDTGYADCDQSAGNGCETDLSLPAHCGTCNTTCSSSSPYCSPTSSGFGCTDSCPTTAPTLCGSQCVDLTSSLDNCGSCNTKCPAVSNGEATCGGSHCAFTCDADFHACAADCASDVSTATCGSSCSPCATEPNAVATCNGVQCGIACETNFADCNGIASDGCEASLLSDSADCGKCGTSCDGRACNSGTCAPAPVVDAGPPPADAAAPPAPDAGSPAPDAASPPPDDAGSGAD